MKLSRLTIISALLLLTIFIFSSCNLNTGKKEGSPVTLVSEGKAMYKILVDEALLPLNQDSEVIKGTERDMLIYDDLGEQREAIKNLVAYVKQVSGAELEVEPAKSNKTGCFIGLPSSFPWLEQDFGELGKEGFSIDRVGESIYIVANNPIGIRHAVTTILMDQGCRWFFPGDIWEEIPSNPSITLYPAKHVPSFDLGRLIWYGYGTYDKPAADKRMWDYFNRMGTTAFVNIGHTNYGIDFEKDFEQHPEWFALVDGKRKASKVCYSHPEVIERMATYAMDLAESGVRSISLSPADGLGFCECDDCLATARGGEIIKDHGSFFAVRPDGLLICTISETLFNAVNQVALRVAEKYPDILIGCYGYSAYSHPPSFKLHENVFIQTTTHYRRTPLGLGEQLELWGDRCGQVGIRGYWSVYQWDWDNPVIERDLLPHVMQENLKFYTDNNATTFVTEASNNWGPRGLSYYIGSRALWDVDVNINGLLKDFYLTAFGPAAEPMQRYYSRWYGRGAIALPGSSNDDEQGAGHEVFDEFGAYDPRSSLASINTLKEAYKDLDEASKLAAEIPKYQHRVDLLRMYAYYLRLRHEVWSAGVLGDSKATVEAIKREVEYGARLTNTNMIHTKPLLGKAFTRLFKEYEPLLKDFPESLQSESGWRVPVQVPPTHGELDVLWLEGKQYLGIE